MNGGKPNPGVQTQAPSSYVGRLAPSPTGELHLGHARTFLVAWLRARQAGGVLRLRMEDIDTPRVVPGAAAAIERDLAWLGLDWDGPVEVQSAHLPRYEAALAALTEGGHVYPCTCSRAEIARLASAPNHDADLGVAYPGTCQRGPSHPDRPASLRLRMPAPPPPFDDVRLGRVDAAAWGGDFVVRRADGVWAYQLAVVVDDLAAGVTEVVRGADLLSSTPRQIALYRALGHAPPRFLHVPLVTRPDGVRLEKRSPSHTLRALREAGVPAERVRGMLSASLGVRSAPGSLGELLRAFQEEALPKDPVVMDPALLLP